MNGKAFLNLKSLKYVWLLKNDCITINSFGQSKLKELANAITKNCKFAEILPDELVGVERFFNFECGKSFYISSRIVAGTETEHGEWPFLVALKHIRKKRFFCSGSLITSQHVLTGENIFSSIS